jgi:hypothetical protein
MNRSFRISLIVFILHINSTGYYKGLLLDTFGITISKLNINM